LIPADETTWITDAHRDDEKRFVVRADEKLTAFLELERALCIHLSEQCRNLRLRRIASTSWRDFARHPGDPRLPQ
jgi:hypothetical protein